MAEHDLEALYREAESALKARNYDRATELLKQILREDHEYRDVSRLLADAVKLRRRRWYSHPLFWSAFGLIVVVSLGFFVAPQLQGLFFADEITPTIRPTEMVLPPKTEVPTDVPMSSPTPIPLAWKRVWLGQELPRDTVTAFAIDPKDPDVLYAGMENAGLYKSIDGGLSWRPTLYGLTDIHVRSLLVDSQDTQVVYAGTPRGIFKTKDGGENWSLIGYESFVLVDPQDNSHLYARDANVIRESTDQGISWKTVYSPQDGCPGNILSWAINPTDGKTLYVGGGDGCERGIYESRDNGHTWALIQKVENPPGYQIAPELDYLVIPMDWLLVRLQDGKAVVEYGPANETPASPGFVYSYCEPFLCKYPQGERGERESVRLGKPDIGTVTFIAPSPYDPNTIYVGGEGVAVTKDGGITWEQSNNGLGNTLLDLAAGLGDEGTLFLLPGECKGELGGGEGHIHDITQSLYHSTNGGSTWDFVTESGCYLIKDVDGATIYRLSTNYWWVGQALKGWLWRSQDGGRSWRRMLIPSDIETIVAHSSQAGHLFGFGKDPFYRTSVNPNFQEKYYYGSSDYGNTWKKQDPLSGTKLCYGSTLHFIDKYRPMTIDPNDGNHVFVIEDGKLLESHDSCDTTDIFATAPNTSMNSIAFDPNKSDVIYAGTDSGAYVSFDGGKTWNEINDGLLGATVVYSIVVDQEGNVYAATPYGIFKLESR